VALIVICAIYGFNIFTGQLSACNDDSPTILELQQCFGEWPSTPFSPQWPVLAPRVVSNPYFNFDTFGDSLLSIFRVVYPSGWADMFYAAQSIRGPDLQPRRGSSLGNGVILIVFNLGATVLILTTFVAVFIHNHAERTGVAYLSPDQLHWLSLREYFYEIKPLIRPEHRHISLRRWYRNALNHRSWWYKGITFILICHLVLLTTQFYQEPAWWTRARNAIFLVFSLLYFMDVAMKFIEIGPLAILRSPSHLFWSISVGGMLVSSILATYMFTEVWAQFRYIHGLFLVINALQLISRSGSFRYTVIDISADIPAILDVLIIWVVFLLAFAIAMTQTFGITRFGPLDGPFINFRTVTNAVILLFRLGFGESWNKFMEHFAATKPPLCVQGSTILDDDCGNETLSRFLFISWNILCTFLFLNSLVAVVYERVLRRGRRSSLWSDLTKEDLNGFREEFAKFDPEGSGFIKQDDLHKVLSRLTGIFDMRIYSHDYNIPSILSNTKYHSNKMDISNQAGIDLLAFTSYLDTLDVAAVRRRRFALNMFVAEAAALANPTRGIAMGTFLELLALYNSGAKSEQFQK
jgi:voltage-dependent calcium channel